MMMITPNSQAGQILLHLQSGKTITPIEKNTKRGGDTNSLTLNGLVVNFLTVIEKTEKRYNGGIVWRCKCVCGRDDVFIKANILKSKRVKSCGCMTKDILRKSKTIHGLSKKPEIMPTFQIWRHMRERCCKKYHKSFKDYGGRGITVCEKWMNFANFYEDMGARPKGMTLGRLNNNIGYTPENCRWETHKEQANNRRNNIFIEFNGEVKTISQWSEFIGISHNALRNRINSGWSISEALTKPSKNYIPA